MEESWEVFLIPEKKSWRNPRQNPRGIPERILEGILKGNPDRTNLGIPGIMQQEISREKIKKSQKEFM